MGRQIGFSSSRAGLSLPLYIDERKEAMSEEDVILQVTTTQISPAVLEEIVQFHNAGFPKSQHTFDGTLRRYIGAALPINILARDADTGRLIGLLESRYSHDGVRQLSTLLVAEDQRGKGIARKLFEKMLEAMRKENHETTIVLHFRESEREHLEPFYAHLGFNPTALPDGVYPISKEPRWRMTRTA